MDQRSNDKIEKALRSWDGIEPAEVSPFLWTRIQARVFSPEQRKLISQPMIQISLAVWMILFVINVSVWFGKSRSGTASSASELRSTFFSDDNPYTSY